MKNSGNRVIASQITNIIKKATILTNLIPDKTRLWWRSLYRHHDYY